MRMSCWESEEVVDGVTGPDGGPGGDGDLEDVGRFVSPRLRQILAAAESAAREGLLRAGSVRLGGDDPERLEEVLSELLEELPGSFYPVYNAERERWELGIR